MISSDSGHVAAVGMAGWLSLAAAPTFAIMALLTAVLGGGPEMLCAAASPLSGMVPMYVLMSAFHAAPWLKPTPRLIVLVHSLLGRDIFRLANGRCAADLAPNGTPQCPPSTASRTATR